MAAKVHNKPSTVFLITRCDWLVADAKVIKTVEVCYGLRRPFFGWRNSSLTISLTRVSVGNRRIRTSKLLKDCMRNN